MDSSGGETQPTVAKNVVMIDEEKAEELKNLGNEEFKNKNYAKAIEYYSQAIGKCQIQSNQCLNLSQCAQLLTLCIEQSRNEGILTNRAASYIQLKKLDLNYLSIFRYKEALLDCEQALFFNRQFLKAYQRAYVCHLALGDLKRAKEAA